MSDSMEGAGGALRRAVLDDLSHQHEERDDACFLKAVDLGFENRCLEKSAAAARKGREDGPEPPNSLVVKSPRRKSGNRRPKQWAGPKWRPRSLALADAMGLEGVGQNPRLMSEGIGEQDDAHERFRHRKRGVGVIVTVAIAVVVMIVPATTIAAVVVLPAKIEVTCIKIKIS